MAKFKRYQFRKHRLIFISGKHQLIFHDGYFTGKFFYEQNKYTHPFILVQILGFFQGFL